MKATGIVRKIDDLGRIVIPKELRKVKGINEGDPLEIYVQGNNIILSKHQSACCFCNTYDPNMKNFCSKLICSNCLKELNKI